MSGKSMAMFQPESGLHKLITFLVLNPLPYPRPSLIPQQSITREKFENWDQGKVRDERRK